MTDIRITELTIPSHAGADGWEELSAAVDLHNLVQRELLETDEFDASARQALALFHDQQRTARHKLLAYDGQRLVGTADVEHERDGNTGWVFVAVHPDHRRRGIGRLLAEKATGLARQSGVTLLQSGAETTDLDSRPRLTAPTGHGDIPADAPSTHFLQEQGFTLRQVELLSALDLPVPEDRLQSLSAAVRDAEDYELISWTGPTPPEWVEAYARLRMVMSTAAPAGELTHEEQVWDADRVRQRDRRHVDGGIITLDTAARHRPSGELVAFTNLAYPAAADGRAVGQGYTLVVPEHRGHSLGMRVKIKNLQQLAEQQHGARRVVTGNAGENDPMLSINRALGFYPAYVAGWWERDIS